MKPVWTWPALVAGVTLSTAIQADPASRGHTAATQFLRGETAPIWAAMTPEMHQALGSADTLAKVRNDLSQRFGQEGEVIAETQTREGELTVYSRVARWTQATAPLRMTVSVDASDHIAGFWVLPVLSAAEVRELEAAQPQASANR